MQARGQLFTATFSHISRAVCRRKALGGTPSSNLQKEVVPSAVLWLRSCLRSWLRSWLRCLFPLQTLLLPLQELMASDGFQHKSAFSFFVARVRQNLHVVLSMDPSNPDFDARCASNPALFASCAVMWLDTWTPERMQVRGYSLYASRKKELHVVRERARALRELRGHVA